MTPSMKIIVAAALAAIPVGAFLHQSFEQTRAQAVRERKQAHVARQMRENAERAARDRARAAQNEAAERDRRKAIVAKAKAFIPYPIPPSHSQPARVRGAVLVWDATVDGPSAAESSLPADLKLADGDMPVTVCLIMAKHQTRVRTYRMVRTESPFEYQSPWAPRQVPCFPLPGRFAPSGSPRQVPGMPQIPAAPPFHEVDTGLEVAGYRTDLDVAIIDLPARQFAGTFRVRGADPPENVSRYGNDLSPEYAPPDGALAEWIISHRVGIPARKGR